MDFNYERNKEHILAQTKAYKQSHKVEVAARNKAWYERKKLTKNQTLGNGDATEIVL